MFYLWFHQSGRRNQPWSQTYQVLWAEIPLVYVCFCYSNLQLVPCFSPQSVNCLSASGMVMWYPGIQLLSTLVATLIPQQAATEYPSVDTISLYPLLLFHHLCSKLIQTFHASHLIHNWSSLLSQIFLFFSSFCQGTQTQCFIPCFQVYCSEAGK